LSIRRKREWELRETEATPEAVFLRRRELLRAAAAGPILASGFFASFALAGEDPSAGLYPAKQNPRYVLDRPLTDEKLATAYNNFYEFGSQKSIADEAQALKLRPWTIKIDGLVDKEMTVDIDDLLKKMPLEERLYRHRCVEAWSMAVPWSGFPMAALVDFAKPLGSAKYLRMETFLDPKTAPGQKEFWYPWPYIEGVTIAEAGNELAFLVTGMYGKPVPKQDGAPLRLVLPWKYGFKSVKSIVRFSFTEKRPYRSGKPCKGASTASGRTSTPTCRTRAGARRASECSASTGGGRRSNGTATANSSPTSITASKRSASSSDGTDDGRRADRRGRRHQRCLIKE
jgi:methionine sulfoxide reductase catalytic subunit